MKKIPSVTFGEVEIDESQIYDFPEGIPGLDGITKYYLIDNPELAPFKWLQACEPNYLSLMVLDPRFIDPDYQVSLRSEFMDVLGECKTEDLSIHSLIVIPEDPKKMTANLLAPIVLNKKALKGMQVVVEGHRNLLRVKVIKE